MNTKNQAIEIMDVRVVEILRKARRSLMASLGSRMKST
jgi:hypothetical protein